MQNKLVALSMHIAENPNDAAAYVERGRLCAEKGMTDEALRDYTKAIDLEPKFPKPYKHRYILNLSVGNINQAKQDCKTLLELDPLEVRALYFLSKTHRFTKNDALFLKVKYMHEKRKEFTTEGQACIDYIMAKYYEDIKNPDLAFKAYVDGGALMNSIHKYDPSHEYAIFNALKQIFPDGFTLPQTTAAKGQTPIFIVGLPRSGTTLLESMIGAHSKAHPAGELTTLLETIGDLNQYIDGQITIDRGAYLSKIKAISDAPYLIDKMPYNFMVIPFIKLLFPNAPIIHIQRTPLDTLISCFTTFFEHGNHWTHTLENLGEYYNLYSDLMTHWRKNLPDSFIDVNYEDLVEDPEVELKRILDYCGLEWEGQCLEFHKSKRVVKTASDLQVRQPLYKSAIGRAEKYKEHLRPIIEAIS